MKRRELLKGSAAALLFPWLREVEAQTAGPRPPKLMLVMQSNGTHQESFWPNAALETSGVLAPLLGVPELRARATVIKGFENKSGGAGNEHDQGFCGWFTGKKSIGSFNDPWAAGRSLDQQLRDALKPTEPFPTLNCGVLASWAELFKPHRYSFSYLGPKLQVPTQTDVYKLYQLFFPAQLGPLEAERELREKRSVLDFVNEDLKRLSPRLPQSERPKLDAHATALRSLEQRLVTSLGQRANAEARCRPAVPSPKLDLTVEANVPALIPLMFDFLALAFACGQTRVVSFQFGQCGERWRFKWLGIDENTHDDVAHHDTGEKTPLSLAANEKVRKMNRWYAEQMAYLGKRFSELPSGDGSLLDDSLIVWVNEMARGNHELKNLPAVLLGRAGGRLTGGKLVDQGPQTYHRLGCSLLNLYGVPAAGFGDEANCGPVRGL